MKELQSHQPQMIYVIQEQKDSLHKEDEKARIERSLADIQKLITTLTTQLSDPFRPEKDNPLRIICTGSVLDRKNTSSPQTLRS